MLFFITENAPVLKKNFKKNILSENGEKNGNFETTVWNSNFYSRKGGAMQMEINVSIC